jgi:hypothetical protein
MKEKEHAAKEELNGIALAQFLFGRGWRQTGAVLLPLWVPGDDGDGKQGGMNPGDQAQTPIRSVQADDRWVDRIEAHSPFEQGAGERSIVGVGRREQKAEGQARAATEQGMHTITV